MLRQVVQKGECGKEDSRISSKTLSGGRRHDDMDPGTLAHVLGAIFGFFDSHNYYCFTNIRFYSESSPTIISCMCALRMHTRDSRYALWRSPTVLLKISKLPYFPAGLGSENSIILAVRRGLVATVPSPCPSIATVAYRARAWQCTTRHRPEKLDRPRDHSFCSPSISPQAHELHGNNSITASYGHEILGRQTCFEMCQQSWKVS